MEWEIQPILKQEDPQGGGEGFFSKQMETSWGVACQLVYEKCGQWVGSIHNSNNQTRVTTNLSKQLQKKGGKVKSWKRSVQTSIIK